MREIDQYLDDIEILLNEEQLALEQNGQNDENCQDLKQVCIKHEKVPTADIYLQSLYGSYSNEQYLVGGSISI